MEGKIKGFVVLSRRQFIEQTFGADVWERVIAALPEADRRVMNGVLLASSWVPLSAVIALDEALIGVVGGRADEAFRALGRKSAETNLPTLQANLLKGKTPQKFLAQVPAIYRLYYEGGTRDYQPTGERSGTITTTGAEYTTWGECLTVMGWHERALELCGAKGVRITHPVCKARGGAVCRYDLRWEQ